MTLDEIGSPFLNVIATDETETVISYYGNSKVQALGGDDTVKGSSGADEIYCAEGNDTVNAGNGDDYLDGGIGNDTLYGDSGNDTYVYGVGYGNDIIYDGNGVNKIKFVGLNPEDMSVYYPNDSKDAILTVTETGETLTIQEFRKHLQYRNFTLEFDNGITGTIDYDTATIVLDYVEGEIEQANALLLSELCSDEGVDSTDFVGTSDITSLSISESVSSDSENVYNQTDIQVMLIAENMSLFGARSKISEGVSLSSFDDNSFATTQLFVGSRA